jgi:murein DD-endopeptidase MepM/ murein hydrolase activator NlpD
MAGKKDLERLRRRKRRKQNIIRATVHFFVWAGVAVLYYIGFSLFFDTPVEYELKHSTDRLRREYAALTQRYDSLTTVMHNLSERDRNVFRILFESDPYDFDSEYERRQAVTYENIFNRSSRRLNQRQTGFQRKSVAPRQIIGIIGKRRALDAASNIRVQLSRNNIPAIQPVINKQLTLLTASYGMRIHPFYKTLQSHQGVDYTIPEGSRVFATADGVVRDVALRNSTSGQTVVIDHGNGYETSYSHLSKINVRKGQRVSRGEIIALSGDTGLSLSPHLHYEVRLNGMRVDPIHYFFMELTPTEYQRLMRIAQSGMQSFD